MKIKLVTTEDPKKVPKVLRQKSKGIKEITPELLKLAGEMIEIMNKNNGIGIAAIQVGVPVCMIAIKDSEADHVFINPEIVKMGRKKIDYKEGCLSFPELFEDVSRPEKVIVRAMNLNGDTVEMDLDGILARVFQHEIDHLEGIVFIDRIGK